MATVTAMDGTSINYDDRGGDGSAVLLVHGITESGGSWDPVVERLRGDHRVLTVDLRGHGASGKAARYDLEAMAGDVVAVIGREDLGGAVHLVGHSLGGAVVSAVGAVAPVSSVVDVDQSLQLGAFKAQLAGVEAMLRSPEAFPAVIEGLFTQLAGPLLGAEETARIGALRRPDQDVVLGVWDLLFTMSEDEIAAVVDGALAGYAGRSVPYLALFGADPGPDYGAWLAGHVPGAEVELWPDHGHYPHLVDPDRFVARLRSFWDRPAAGS